MRVAIIHYHLLPGGVTTVIHEAARALEAAGIDHVILTGDQIAGLGYLSDAGALTAEALTENLRDAATDALGAAPDIWHFHNHSLGKNPLLAQVVSLLARSGECLVLQIHDLAEQGRPANLPLLAGCAERYPIAPRVRYVFLNAATRDSFTGAGLPLEHTRILPNPVPVSQARHESPPASSDPLLFAPIRGIRRKNIGELVLLAALAPAGARVAISRAPTNPDAIPIHANWCKFAADRGLPIGFDVVDRYTPAADAGSDFQSWNEHATHFVTTSVCEGFGLPFLESIAHGKPLLGRDLPVITATHGIRFPHLYQRILIPVDWIDRVILESHLGVSLERDFRYYGRPAPTHLIGEILTRMIDEGWVDFGNLPEPLQQGVIERLTVTADRRVPQVAVEDRRLPLEDWLATTLRVRTPAHGPETLEPWSSENYGKSLRTLYQELSGQAEAPVGFLPTEAILDVYTSPHCFHFLLSAPEPRQRIPGIRAVILDIYGTLLLAPAGGVRPDPFADPVIREVIRQFGHEPPISPSGELHAAVRRHHAASSSTYPEIDLRILWREVLELDEGHDTAPLVAAIEAAWHPATFMPGAERFIYRVAGSGLSLGLLSNAQSNTLGQLGPISDFFAPELTLLSYQHGMAKPSPELFEILVDRLAGRGIGPAETLYIGDSREQDIAPAEAAGFQTLHFTGPQDWKIAAGLLGRKA